MFRIDFKVEKIRLRVPLAVVWPLPINFRNYELITGLKNASFRCTKAIQSWSIVGRTSQVAHQVGLPPALGSSVPIYTPRWKEAL